MQRSYTDALIEEVVNRSDMVAVVSQYVKLKKTGKNHKGLCPFHNEKTPSFIVSEERQRYHCFGCGASGDVIEFIMNIEKLDFVDALEYLAEQNGIRLEDYLKKHDNTKPVRDKSVLYDLMREAAIYYYKNLKTNDSALEYLKNREINVKTIKTFGLGYAAENWDGAIRHINKVKGFSLNDMERCGLIIKREKSSGYYDRFRNRIMFPIFDIRGRVVGFGGRVLDDSLPKYLNSPETELFNKRNLLFGLNFAKKYTGEEKRIVIVEGYMDVIALYARGIRNTVASLGTALTEDHANLLKRYGKEIILSYDSDSAGEKATIKAMGILEKTNCKIKVIHLQGAKDPDEYVKKNGIDAYKDKMHKSLPVLDYRISLLRNKFERSNPQERIEYLEAMKNLFDTIKEPLQKEVYLKKINNEEPEIGSLLEKAFANRQAGKKYKRVDRNRIYKVDKKKKYETARILLGILMSGKEVFQSMEKFIEKSDFELGAHKHIFDSLITEYGNNETVFQDRMAELLDIESIEELTQIYSMDISSIISDKNPREVIFGCIVAMRMNRIENELKGFDKNKLEKEGDLVKIKELYNELNRYRNLRNRNDELNEFDLLPPGKKKGGESN
ncbi:MAG TPA: DNA primase [Clostridia bacterium]|nr:DNA primase [Clostridia bacterium]